MSISKSKIDVYKIRNSPDGFGWADIAIDAGWLDSTSGKQNCFRITISSDYGNWVFCWGHPGACWKSFLLSVNIGYVARKFDCDNWFDIDATVNALKKDLIKKCREDGKVTSLARDAFKAIENADLEYGDNKDLFHHYLIDSDWSTFWGEYWLDSLETRTDIDPQFKTFWDGPWQEFLGFIREELSNEEKKSA